MHRFVAVLWNPAAPEANARATSWINRLSRECSAWQTVFRRDGAQVFIPKGVEAFTAFDSHPDSRGVVIGRLFERGYEGRGRIDVLPADVCRRIERTLGDELVTAYWGQYVALWHDPKGDQTIVQRDPSGAVPVFRYNDRGADLLFAHAGDIAGLGIQGLSFNWTRIEAFLRHNYFTTDTTGICEFTELGAGKRLIRKSSGGLSEQWSWSAAEIAAAPDLRGLDDLRAELRETVTSCFTAFGSQFGRTLVQLSGGLDSSILLGVLKQAGCGDVVALHTVAQGYEAFEARLARMMAAHTDTRFVTRRLADMDGGLRQILDIPLLARPDRQIMGAPANALIESVCSEFTIDAVMAGHGGDSLFLQRSAATHTLPDYIRLHGWTREVMGIAYDAAMLQQRSIWAVLNGGLKAMRRRDDWDPYAFLRAAPAGTTAPQPTQTQPAQTDDSAALHPWLAAAKALPPGKATQVSHLVGMYNYYAVLGYGLTRESVDPYLSQPIIEFALRVPTYQFCRGGVDRSLQRSAFADLLPSAIRRRTGKGFVNNHLLKGIERNAPFLRELLHTGELVKRGLLDRRAVDPLFSEESLVDGSALTLINSLSATEAWLHAWRKSGALAA